MCVDGLVWTSAILRCLEDAPLATATLGMLVMWSG